MAGGPLKHRLQNIRRGNCTFFLACLLFFLQNLDLAAQTPDPEALKDLIETYFRDYELASSENESQTLLENLERRLENPLNLNLATEEELAELHLLSATQIENFLAYRARLGSLLSIFELQAIPGWEIEDAQRIQNFVKIGSATGPQQASQLLKMIFSGKNEALARFSQPPPLPDSDKFLGSKQGFGLRFRHQFQNQLSYGFTAEKDPGEQFFRGSNRQGFDFYSAHFFLQNFSKTLKTIALGDFSAQFGQGLLLQSGFAPGKSSDAIRLLRSGVQLRPYRSFGEVYFFRGAGAVFNFGKNFSCTAFASHRRKDANLDLPTDTDENEPAEIFFTAQQTSGWHRTESEIADRNSIRETVGGLSVGYAKQNNRLAINLLHVQFDKNQQPRPAAYRQFAFAGKQLFGGSVDYRLQRRNLIFFGETAVSDNLRAATLNGLLLGADRRATLALFHRHFSSGFQSVFAAPFQEGSAGANERGLYLGGQFRPLKRWQLDVYADLWRYPWLRLTSDAPAGGHEFLGKLQFELRRKLTAFLYFQSKTKTKDIADGVADLLQTVRRDRLRLQAEIRASKATELTTRLEWSFYKTENQPLTRGFLAYLDWSYRRPGSPLAASLRYAIFETEDSETRVFTFERDLFSSLAVPFYSGRGTRFYGNFSWKINKAVLLEARVGQTVHQKSVSELIPTGRRTEVKLQAQVRF